MHGEPEGSGNLEFDLADIVELFEQFEENDRERTDQQTEEEIIVQIGGIHECDRNEESEIDKDSLDCRHRFPGVLDIIARFI